MENEENNTDFSSAWAEARERDRRAERAWNAMGAVSAAGLVVACFMYWEHMRQVALYVSACIMFAAMAVAVFRAIADGDPPPPEEGWLGEECRMAPMTWVDFLPYEAQKDMAHGEPPCRSDVAAAKAAYQEWIAKHGGEGQAGAGEEKYIAQDVPASPATPEVLVDEYNPEYLKRLRQRLEKQKPLEPGGPGLEIIE